MQRLDVKRVQVLDALEALQRQPMQACLVARQLMSTDLSCVSSESNLLDLLRLIHAKGFRHLLVTDAADRLLGVISDRDLLRVLGPGDGDKQQLAGIPAVDLMSTDLVTVEPETPLVEVIGILLDNGISCLPVVELTRPVGIVTSTDLILLLQMLLQTLGPAGVTNPSALVSH